VSAGRKQFQLRDFRPQDFETLWQIDQLCYEPLIAYSRRDLRAFLNARGAECVVAEKHGEIIGFCITAQQEIQAYIVTIDVLNAYRRHGVGTALLQEVERRAAANGAQTMALDTGTNNSPAIAFWEKHGYRKIGVREGYYPNGTDAFAMIKSLAKKAAGRS
jgi:ribosomal protein S18 acetylase RimI-like enzyme